MMNRKSLICNKMEKECWGLAEKLEETKRGGVAAGEIQKLP